MALAPVPFIGCESGGQVGPVEAPKTHGAPVLTSRRAAQKLSYFKSAQGPGVLAPRGWHCFAVYGSGSSALFVSPRPIDAGTGIGNQAKFAGPVVEVSYVYGETSGRFTVAEIIARLFPAYTSFVTDVMELLDMSPADFPAGPYPADKLNYKSKRVAEYQTPGQSDGLGTTPWLQKNSSPIHGVAIVTGPAPDLLLVGVRLPPDLTPLTPAILQQVEREAARAPQQ